MEEAYAIGDLLKEAHKDVSIEVSSEKPKKVVTLTSDVISTMQINRLSKSSGTEYISKAFCSDFNDEVKAFING